jgi:hypothetical protein
MSSLTQDESIAAAGDSTSPAIATIDKGVDPGEAPPSLVDENHDQLEDSQEEQPESHKPKKPRHSYKPHEKNQVVARRNLTLEEFVKELTNFHNIPAEWKDVVELVRLFLIDLSCPNSCIVLALRTVQRSKMGMQSEHV